jgi:hypothetical protein
MINATHAYRVSFDAGKSWWTAANGLSAIAALKCAAEIVENRELTVVEYADHHEVVSTHVAQQGWRFAWTK